MFNHKNDNFIIRPDLSNLQWALDDGLCDFLPGLNDVVGPALEEVEEGDVSEDVVEINLFEPRQKSADRSQRFASHRRPFQFLE